MCNIRENNHKKRWSGRARARSRDDYDDDTELFPATRPPIAPRDEITPCGEPPHSDLLGTSLSMDVDFELEVWWMPAYTEQNLIICVE